MVTIFTPTYNRGYIIENLYRSLTKQTCKDFEWIIVDDGSTDNTKNICNRWLQESPGFIIRYEKVKNGGKHRAINRGVRLAEGDIFFIVDSDDYLTDTAIEIVENWYKTIRNNTQYAGVSGLKGYSEDSPIGGWGNFDTKYVDATNLERERYGLMGDKAEIYKTSILRKYPFPEFEDENFLTEGIVWNKIAQEGYKLRWYKKVIYICDYLNDGLTRTGYRKSIENPKGYMAYLNQMSEIYGEKHAGIYKFGFYFVLRNENDMYTCKDIMQISVAEMDRLEIMYHEMIQEMNHYFLRHNIVTVALYGFGNVGKAFRMAANMLSVDIKYIIEKNNRVDGNIRIYSPDEDLERVDAVVITMKDYNKEAENILKKRFEKVIYWKDISLKYWRN